MYLRRATLQFIKFLISIICLSIIVITTSSYAGEEIEDLIDIAESKGKIIAVIEGKQSITYNLRPNEKVRWSGSRGELSAFLTDLNFFVISTSSNAWLALPLKLDESEKTVVSLSPYIALLATSDRAIGFDAATGRVIETQLPIRDELLAARAERYVAVVISSSRAFGLTTESWSFKEITFRTNEKLEKIKLTYSKATAQTSNRLLTFESSGTIWKEHRPY